MRDAEAFVRRKLQESPDLTPAQKRTAALGERLIHRYGEWLTYEIRLKWARDCFVKGRVIEAVKQVRHAACSYVRYRRSAAH